jgi:hypothetical protein
LLWKPTPTVLRIGGMRVVIYPNDHRPAHVHVVGGGGHAVFLLNCPAGPPALRGAKGLSTISLNAIEAVLLGAVAILCEAWESIHGHH